MIKVRLLSAALLSASLLTLPTVQAGDGSIKLIHMGDLHGHLVPRPNVRSDSSGVPEGGLAHMYTRITAIRSAAVKSKIPSLLINTGDTIQGSAEAMFTRGQSVVDVLNLFNIDVFTPGNWDYLYGRDRFVQLFAGNPTLGVAPLAPWNAIAANLYYSGVAETPGAVCPNAAGKRVLPAYRIVTMGNVKVGIVSMTTERGIAAIGPKATEGLTFTNGEAELSCFVDYLRNNQQVDSIVMTSELELGKTIKMTERIPGVDVVLNADMHEESAKTIVNNVGTILVEEGQDGTALGELTLKIVGKKVASYTWIQHVINSKIAPDKSIAAKILAVRRPFTSGPGYVPNQSVTIGGNTTTLLRPIDTVVGTAGVSLHRSNFSHEDMPAAVEGSSHDLLTDAFRWATGSDLSTVRGFRYGTHIPAGQSIKMEDLYHYMPIAPAIAKAGPVNAWQLKDQVENSTNSVFDIDARNWRGGWMFGYSGATLSVDPYQPWGCRGSNIKVNGVSLSPASTETSATLSGIVNNQMASPRTASAATAVISNGNYDKATKAYTMTITVTGIAAANITGMHIHAGACGVNGGILVPLPTSGWTTNANGSISMTVSGTFPAASEATLLSDSTYLNIHTVAYSGGEIRGQVIATTKRQFTVAGYWYADDPNTINNCGGCSAGTITPLKDSSGKTIDATELVVNYLASLPNRVANPALRRVTLVRPLPISPYGFNVIQPLEGAQ